MNTNIASQSTYWLRRSIFAVGFVLATYFVLLPLVIIAGQAGAGFLIALHDGWVAIGLPVTPSVFNN